MKIFKPRYIILIVMIIAFVVYVLFFDRNNLQNRREILAEIAQLEQQIEYYRATITADSLLIENLKDDEFLEAYAREHFLLKRENETVIVIE